MAQKRAQQVFGRQTPVIDGGQSAAPAKTANPPAWLGRAGNNKPVLDGGRSEADEQGGQTWGKVGSGSMNYGNTTVQNWQEPMQNTERTDRRVLDDNVSGGPVMNYGNMLPGKSNVSNAPLAPKPAWFRGAFDGQPVFNPRTGQAGRNPLPYYMSSDENVYTPEATFGTLRMNGQRTTNDGDAEVWVNPDGTVISRNYPETTPSQGRPPGGVVYMAPPPVEAPAPSNGFGTTYGGNWRRSGGGGGGGWGGYGGGGDYPAWAANMGLYSLKWGG